jgi:hypothetical protein
MTENRTDAPYPTRPAEAIDRLAGQLDGVERRVSGQSVEFARSGLVFVASDGGRFEFRLRSEIVTAALRTSGTSPSQRGTDWIALETDATDGFTLDRAIAWFETAWRIAGEVGPH